MKSSDALTLSRNGRNRLYRTARALAYAASVFGDADHAAKWMKKRNEALGGAIPLQLLETIEGDAIVRAELAAIDHGLPV